jgi:hypothetical protein
MRGFQLLYGKRPAAALAHIPVEDPVDAKYPDGRFRGSPDGSSMRSKAALTSSPISPPDFAAGYRVQQLIDAAQRSHRQGTAIKVTPVPAGEELRA